MPKKIAAPSIVSLKRQLRAKETELQDQLSRNNELSVKLFDGMTRWANFHSTLSAKNVEIGRLQGYIDRVLDEGRRSEGRQVSGPVDPLARIRETVTDSPHWRSTLDQMSEDDIERMTGRDDD